MLGSVVDPESIRFRRQKMTLQTDHVVVALNSVKVPNQRRPVSVLAPAGRAELTAELGKMRSAYFSTGKSNVPRKLMSSTRVGATRERVLQVQLVDHAH